MRGIYALYESFRRFQKLQTAPGRVPSPKQAWIDITEAVLNDGKSSIVQAEDRITEFITKEKLFQECLKVKFITNRKERVVSIHFKYETIKTFFLFQEVEGDMLCTTNQSPQQVLYNLYNSIALTELKGYMMMQFSYMLLKLYNKGKPRCSLIKFNHCEFH